MENLPVGDAGLGLQTRHGLGLLVQFCVWANNRHLLESLTGETAFQAQLLETTNTEGALLLKIRREVLFLWQSNCHPAQGMRCPWGADALGAGWGSWEPLTGLGPSPVVKMSLLSDVGLFVCLPRELSGAGGKTQPMLMSRCGRSGSCLAPGCHVPHGLRELGQLCSCALTGQLWGPGSPQPSGGP